MDDWEGGRSTPARVSRRALCAALGLSFTAGCNRLAPASTGEPTPTASAAGGPTRTETPSPTPQSTDLWAQFQNDTGNRGWVDAEPFAAGAEPTVAWRSRVGESLSGGLVLAADAVFGVTDDGTVLALERGDGSRRWHRSVEGVAGGSTPALSTDGSTLLCLADDGVVHAFETGDGTPAWETQTTATVGVDRAAPTVAADAVYVGAERLHALDVRTGGERWRAGADYGAWAPAPAVGGGLVAVAGTGERVQLLDRTGAERGAVDAPFGAIAPLTMTVDGSTLLHAGLDGHLTAYGVPDLGERWRTPLSERDATITCSPACDRETAYVAVSDGTLAAVSLADGSVTWRRSFGMQLVSDPCGAGTRLYLGVGDTIRALDRGSGETAWAFEADDVVFSPPALAPNRLAFGTAAGSVYLLEPGG